MSDTKDLLIEMEHEVVSAGKLLERIPEDKLEWQPHPKAMTLGALALHVASIPGIYTSYAADGTTDLQTLISHPQPRNKEEIINGFKIGIEKARDTLGNYVRWAADVWKLDKDKKTVFTVPRSVMVRLLTFNHWYHHRGQLTTYLRILGVELPSIYGPSADEDPFA